MHCEDWDSTGRQSHARQCESSCGRVAKGIFIVRFTRFAILIIGAFLQSGVLVISFILEPSEFICGV
jgi:hypothetical protein